MEWAAPLTPVAVRTWNPRYFIVNDEFPRDIVTATDEIFSATFELQDLFSESGKAWRRASSRLKAETPNGSTRFDMSTELDVVQAR